MKKITLGLIKEIQVIKVIWFVPIATGEATELNIV